MIWIPFYVQYSGNNVININVFALGSGGPSITCTVEYNMIYSIIPLLHHSRYCKVIADTVVSEPSQYKSDLLTRLLDLASRLKYHDLSYMMGEGEIADKPDPQWLVELQTTVKSLAILNVSNSLTFNLFN